MPDANKILEASPESIQEAADVLAGGGLVAVPTETVYGLAANALDEKAVGKIFEAKGRPADKPLIIFVPDLNAAKNLVKFTALAEKLAAGFWPGALTLVLDKKADCRLPKNVTGGLKTLGLRVPGHPAAQSLVQACSFPLAVTSVNLTGQPSPTIASDVTLPVDLVLDGGHSKLGLESTVLDARGETPVFLRDGATSRFEIGELFRVPL